MCFGLPSSTTNPSSPRTPTVPGAPGARDTAQNVVPRNASSNASKATPLDYLDRSARPTLGQSANALATTQGIIAGGSGTGASGLVGQVANIIEGVVQSAGQIIGAVATGAKSLIDAGVSLFGVFGNFVSEFLSIL